MKLIIKKARIYQASPWKVHCIRHDVNGTYTTTWRTHREALQWAQSHIKWHLRQISYGMSRDF